MWEGYTGGAADSVDVEVYQPWLAPAGAADLAAQAERRGGRHSHAHEHGHAHGQSQHGGEHVHAQSDAHAHAHGPIDHGDHVHEVRTASGCRLPPARGPLGKYLWGLVHGTVMHMCLGDGLPAISTASRTKCCLPVHMKAKV